MKKCLITIFKGIKSCKRVRRVPIGTTFAGQNSRNTYSISRTEINPIFNRPILGVLLIWKYSYNFLLCFLFLMMLVNRANKEFSRDTHKINM
mmetsp:Transcript_16870/g.19510  ORF Transcript_16870/g.19510 Transcript_16870/m.19510 type:complete len:92 (+) Transcript_16870:14-289(+)